MAIITEGRIIGFAVLIIIVGAIYYYLARAAGGNPANLRRLPQIDVIDELIARAVEMNREVWFLSGGGQMTNAFVLPGILSTFGICAYVTEQCARYGAKIHHVCRLPIAYNVHFEIMREAYEKAGKPEEFDPLETIIYIPSGAGRPYVLNESWRRKPASAIMCGAWYHQTIIFCEAIQRAGAMTLGGTDTTHNIPFMVAANNYSMIGEEMYAMSAYLSEYPTLASSLAGQDIGKYIVIILCIIGVILHAAGIPFSDWLG
jgi:hypothetical protein